MTLWRCRCRRSTGFSENIPPREIARAFGLLPMLSGIRGDNTFANDQEAIRSFFHRPCRRLKKREAVSCAPV